MATPYDVRLRERAVMAYERGEGSYARLAALFGVDRRTLERWVARWRTARALTPRPRGGGWRSPIDLAVLTVLVREVPDTTLGELATEYNRRVPRAQRTTRASVHRALVREGFVLKKNGRGRVRLIGPTSSRRGPSSGDGNAVRPRVGWSFSTKPAPISPWAARTSGFRAVKNTSNRGR